MESLARYLNGKMVLAAAAVFKSPTLGVPLYLLALLGVYLSPNRPAPHLGRSTQGETAPAREDPGDPAAFVVARLHGAKLRTIERFFAAGDQIYCPGDPSDRLYFLREGVVRLYKPYGNSKRATVGLLRDGGMFGRPDLPGTEGIQDEFAEAMTRCTVVSVRKASLAWLVKRDPEEASLALYSALSQKMRLSEEFAAALLPREVSSRLAALLVNLSGRFGPEEQDGRIIDLRLTHQDLADMVASTREAVSKSMSDFQREGLVEGRIVVLDRPGLRRRAEG